MLYVKFLYTNKFVNQYCYGLYMFFCFKYTKPNYTVKDFVSYFIYQDYNNLNSSYQYEYNQIVFNPHLCSSPFFCVLHMYTLLLLNCNCNVLDVFVYPISDQNKLSFIIRRLLNYSQSWCFWLTLVQ